ncbi:MAG: nucleotidyltransferase domain-containing protein [Dehalococcoidia bacterium]|nr:nucleotidyltransferase domain-containing protein [Dehalococcoidia bacterium]
MPETRPDDSQAHAIARRVSARLAEVPGVAAVVLGGSQATGNAEPGSDIDLGIYYHPAQPLDLGALRALATELDDRPAGTVSDRGPEGVVTVPGEWGPWMNGGAWLRVDRVHVDWLYRDIERVSDVIAECRAGRVTADYYPGYAHAFHNHIYLAETAAAVPLFDPGNVVAALKALVTPYPAALRAAIMQRYLFDARFTLAHAAKPAARGDILVVSGDLFRSAACLVQVLFALNETYFLSEKGALARVDGFARKPRGFRRTVERVLAAPGRTPAALAASVAAFATLTADVDALCSGEGLR